MDNINYVYSRHNVDMPIKRLCGAKIPYYDLTIVLRGTLNYVLDGKKITVSSGDALYMKPGTLREREENHDKFDYISFNFRTEEPPELPLVIRDVVSEDITLLVAAYDSFPNTAIISNKRKYTHILSCILLCIIDKVRLGAYSPLTQKIIEYINGNLNKKITLADIGAATFFSPIYCDTVFKKDIGRPITDYILEAKMSEAKRLIAGADNIPLSAVSELVGFSDYNYFCRTFKKRTRYTPTEYRRITSG